MRYRFLFRLKALLLICALPVFADPPAKPSESSSKASDKDSPKTVRTSRKKGRVAREKEAEGTQALNRFDNDSILKSKYEHNGQSLEVDPD